MRMLRDGVRARELACATSHPQANPARRRTRPENIPMATTVKNDGHGFMSMEFHERAFGPRKLRKKVLRALQSVSLEFYKTQKRYSL